MIKTILASLAVMITMLFALAESAIANNVIPIKTELSQTQIEWLDEHRSEEVTGLHERFVWYRDSHGTTWSVSINEYRKTGSEDVIEYMNTIINERLDEERGILRESLSKGRKLIVLLTQAGMSFEQAAIITSALHEGFTITPEGPVMVSGKYKDLVVR